jgi:CBS domain-containing membrane protein
MVSVTIEEMPMDTRQKPDHQPPLPESCGLSDEDIYEAMKEIPGYLDITPGDFKELYQIACRLALKRITQSVTADDIMTRDVVTVKRQTPLLDVAKLMADKGVAGVPVIEEDGRVAGIIAERDFLVRMGALGTESFMGVVEKCLMGKGCVAAPIRAQKAEDVMTSPVVTVQAETISLDISNLFRERKINRVPVVDNKGRLIGIVSREDIVHSPLISKTF